MNTNFFFKYKTPTQKKIDNNQSSNNNNKTIKYTTNPVLTGIKNNIVTAKKRKIETITLFNPKALTKFEFDLVYEDELNIPKSTQGCIHRNVI